MVGVTLEANSRPTVKSDQNRPPNLAASFDRTQSVAGCEARLGLPGRCRPRTRAAILFCALGRSRDPAFRSPIFRSARFARQEEPRGTPL